MRGTKVLSAADDSIAVTDAIITALTRTSIQIDSALGGLTPLAVGDIVALSGSTGAGNNAIFRVAEELVADDSYVFKRLGDNPVDCSTETVDAVNLLHSQGFMRIDSADGCVLQFPAGTYSIQPMLSVDGKLFVNEGSAVTGASASRVTITSPVNWLRLNVGSVTGSVIVAVDH